MQWRKGLNFGHN